MNQITGVKYITRLKIRNERGFITYVYQPKANPRMAMVRAVPIAAIRATPKIESEGSEEPDSSK